MRPVCGDCDRVVFHNPAVGVAVVLRDDAGRVLLARRNGTYAGSWCIPCGYVEWGEDVRDAAVREMKEETGLDVELGEVIAVHSNFHDERQLTVGIWFHGTVTGGRLTPDTDVDAVEWCDLDAPPGDLAFPTDELVIDRLRDDHGTPT